MTETETDAGAGRTLPPTLLWYDDVIPEGVTHGEPVYRPTEEERRMLDEALADLRREPDSGRSWESVREEI